MTKLKAILIGFGNIAEEMAHDRVKAKSTAYASHAQVLRDHPDIDWVAVIEPSIEKRQDAKSNWGVGIAVSDVQSLPASVEPDIAVIATKPEFRTSLVDQLPTLKGVLVEKPLGTDIAAANEFVDLCEKRDIKAQVNYWRRGDAASRTLAEGGLATRIGQVQTAFGIYGNGFRNNAVHMIDYMRMLLGEVRSAQALSEPQTEFRLSITGDVVLPFSLTLEGGAQVTFHPLNFKFYRENSLEIWGQNGCISIFQEGWRLRSYSKRPHATLGNADEVDFDNVDIIESSASHAFYEMHDNLVNAIVEQTPLWSSARSALCNEEVLEAVLQSAQQNCTPIELPK